MIDSFGRVIDHLRLSVTDRCFFRCVYCKPEQGIPLLDRAQILRYEEILRIVGLLARDLGIRKVRLTGGEPLLRRDLVQLTRGLKALPGIAEVVMTTNGVLLPRHAAALREAGLSRVNISLDSLRDERLRMLWRDRISVADIEAAIDAAKEQGLTPIKINCVVIEGVNEDEVAPMILWSRRRGVKLRFIEQMPSWPGSGIVGREEILARASELGEVLRVRECDDGGTARHYRVADTVFGIIPASSGQLCRNCRRLRITADGRLQACLGRPGELSLRDLLRAGADDEELVAAIREVVGAKALQPEHCRPLKMWQVGG